MMRGVKKCRVFLGLYDPLDPDSEPEPIPPQFVPNTVADAIVMMKDFNERAARNPKLTQLLGLFPVAPKVRANVRRRKPNVEAERGA